MWGDYTPITTMCRTGIIDYIDLSEEPTDNSIRLNSLRLRVRFASAAAQQALRRAARIKLKMNKNRERPGR